MEIHHFPAISLALCFEIFRRANQIAGNYSSFHFTPMKSNLKGKFPIGVFLLAGEKKTKEKKLNNVQLSFESASVKICKNKLTNQIEEKAEYFSTREQKNSQWKSALRIP